MGDEGPTRGTPSGEEPIEQLEGAALAVWHNLFGAGGYLPVLLIFFASMISIPLIGDSPNGSFFNVLLVSAGLVITVFRSTTRRRLRHATVFFTALGCAASLGAQLTLTTPDAHRDLVVALMVIYLAMLVLCFPLMLVRSLQHKRVTLNTLCATLSAYLLIGLIFMSAYRLMGLLAPPFFAETTTATAGQYAYFSFITLTTVGFGDLTAGSDPARSLVMVEAVLGQVFLVTTVARAVSLLGEDRQASRLVRDSGSEGEDAG